MFRSASSGEWAFRDLVDPYRLGSTEEARNPPDAARRRAAPFGLASWVAMVHQSATSTCRDKPMAAITAAAPFVARDRDLHNRMLVRGWLYLVLLVLVALVLVGGATRLTESGLSITEWQPIHGVVPPLNDAEWQEEFQRYQQIPQYAELNKGMSMEAFKTI